MPTFQKKPIIVEAFRFGYDSPPDWFVDALESQTITISEEGCHIHTLEGIMFAPIGSYVIQGVSKEIYPCRYDIFVASYEEIESQ